MSNEVKLNLPESFEDLKSEIGDNITKMSQFVVPVEDAEKKLTIISQTIKNSGKIVFLLGPSGVGKSTFIRSLTWRKHLPISRIEEIDATELYDANGLLNNLYQSIYNIASKGLEVIETNKLLTVVINYLEDFVEQDETDVRAFFRKINGLLRKQPVLIIWPVTDEKQAIKIVSLAKLVSSTIFTEDPILNFEGPRLSQFTRITKMTISELNNGLSPEDFLLNDDTLRDLLNELREQVKRERTIRNYIKSVKAEWSAKSNEVEKMLAQIPKPTEIWFIVAYPEAEEVVSQFARKSSYVPNEDAWDGDYNKFSEYIQRDTKNAAEWDSKQLQMALRGVFRTKVIYIPTNALVSCVAAFGKECKVSEELLKFIWSNTNKEWAKKWKAKRFLVTSPLVRQLKGESISLGKRLRGNSPDSIAHATSSFVEINKFINQHMISDTVISRCLASGLRTCLNLKEDETESIVVEGQHPWLKAIRPDIMVNLDKDRIICIEMHYTADKTPGKLANYVLGKLHNYMTQLKAFSKAGSYQPSLFNE